MKTTRRCLTSCRTPSASTDSRCGQTDGRTDGWTNRQADGRTDGKTVQTDRQKEMHGQTARPPLLASRARGRQTDRPTDRQTARPPPLASRAQVQVFAHNVMLAGEV
jgi:hypothetical protein